MEMPVSYIILKIAEVLIDHKKSVKITKYQIGSIIDSLLEDSRFSEEEKEEMIKGFSLNGEVSAFLDNSIYFYEDEEGNIVLHKDTPLEEFDDMLDSEREDYDNDLLDRIDDFFDYNLYILELLDIRINKELFINIERLQVEIEKEYNRLAMLKYENKSITEEELHKLKILSVKRNLLFSYIKGAYTHMEYEDMYSYSRHLNDFDGTTDINFKLKNDELKEFVEEDSFHRALFFLENNVRHNLSNKFYPYIFMSTEEKSKNKFYREVLSVTDKRIKNPDNESIVGDLNNARYRLMCSIDTTYGDFILKDYQSDKEPFIPDYSFIRKEIYYFIGELYLYNDFEMANPNSPCYYDNTIKSILVEAYYNLTGDEEVVKMIKKYSDYGKGHFVSYLLENIVDRSKGKIRRKEDE